MTSSCQHVTSGMHRRHANGFTQVELIVVIVLTAVLAFVALPRFSFVSTFSVRGFADQIRSAIQYGRKAAVAQRRNVCVAVDTTGLKLTRASLSGAAAACDGALIDPATGTAYVIGCPAGIVLSSSASGFGFSGLGATQPSGGVVLSVSDGTDTVNFSVERETGYVH